MRCYEVTDEVRFGIVYERAGDHRSMSLGDGEHRLEWPIQGRDILESRVNSAAQMIKARTGWSAEEAEAFVREEHRMTHFHFATWRGETVAAVDGCDDPRDERVALVLVRPSAKVRYTDNCASARLTRQASRVAYRHPTLTKKPGAVGVVVLEELPGAGGHHLLAEMCPGATLRIEFERAVRYLKWSGSEMTLGGRVARRVPHLRIAA